MTGIPAIGQAIILVLTLLVGGGGGGFFIAWRKDKRQAVTDKTTNAAAELDLTETVQRIAKNAVADAKLQMDEQDAAHQRKIQDLISAHATETARLRQNMIDRLLAERRIWQPRLEQLEQIIRDAGHEVPVWPHRAEFVDPVV